MRDFIEKQRTGYIVLNANVTRHKKTKQVVLKNMNDCLFDIFPQYEQGNLFLFKQKKKKKKKKRPNKKQTLKLNSTKTRFELSVYAGYEVKTCISAGYNEIMHLPNLLSHSQDLTQG